MLKFLKNSLMPKKVGTKRKGFTLVELMVAMSIVILLGGSAFFAYGHVQQMRKIAQVTTDMEAISAACLAYESLNVNGTLPATLDALAAGLTAADSIDGSDHTDLLQSSKRGTGTGSATITANIKDPWGNDYAYSQTARTITCVPKDANNNNLPAIVRSF